MFGRRFFGCAAILTGIAVLGAAPPAEAAFKLRVSFAGTGGPFNVVEDNMVGDTNPLTGIIAASFPNGGGPVTMVVASGLSQPFTPNALDLGLQVVATAAGSLVVDITDTGYGVPPNFSTMWQTPGSITPVLGSGFSGTWQGWLDTRAAGTNEFTTAPATGVVSPGAQAFGTAATTVLVNSAAPYSLTGRAVLTFTAAGVLSTDSALTVNHAPEPATLVSALIGLPLAGAWLRRRKAA